MMTMMFPNVPKVKGERYKKRYSLRDKFEADDDWRTGESWRENGVQTKVTHAVVTVTYLRWDILFGI